MFKRMVLFQKKVKTPSRDMMLYIVRQSVYHADDSERSEYYIIYCNSEIIQVYSKLREALRIFISISNIIGPAARSPVRVVKQHIKENKC